MKLNLNQIKKFFISNRALIIILSLSFILSLSYAFYFKIDVAVDARAYDNIGWSLASGQGYREDLNKDMAYDASLTRVGPLYQFFLAGIYKIFGHHYEPVWVAQALLHTLSAWLIYLTALLVFAKTGRQKIIGLWAAALFGWHPDLIEISAMLMIETFYLFWVCLAVYIFFWYWSRANLWSAALLGLTTGLAVLTRSPVLFFVPVVLWYFYQKKQWRQGVLFLAVLALVFVPWTARNYEAYHQFLPLGGSGAFNFWIGNYHGADGEQSPTTEHFYFVDNKPMAELQSESVRNFKLFLRQRPGEFIKLTALRVNKYFSLIRPMGFWFYQSGWGQLVFVCSSAAAIILLFTAGFGGLIKALRLKESASYYLASFLVITPLILFVTVVESRYRFQIYPLLAIFAGFFITEVLGRKNWLRDKDFWLASGVLAANSLLDLALSWGKLKERLSQFF